MFQIGAVEPRIVGVSSNGYLRRKTGQKRFCRFNNLEQATRTCSILMVFVDCQYPRDSLAASGFSHDQIEDIMTYFKLYDTKEDDREYFNGRWFNELKGDVWVLKNPKQVYRVAGLPVTVSIQTYVRYPHDLRCGHDDSFGIDKKATPEEVDKEKEPELDSFDNLDKRGISLMPRYDYYSNPWPADTRWSIIMPLREFYQHVQWEITRLITTGVMSELVEKEVRRATGGKQSYFDSSAYIYYP